MSRWRCKTGKPFAECCLAEGVKLKALSENTVRSMRGAGIQHELVYAYEWTGIIVVRGLRSVWCAADLDERDDAISEYRELHPDQA